MRMPSMWSTVLSTAARRARVSRLPRPASTRRRVRSVSSRVMLPELPDAKMETRKPIVFSPTAAQTNFLNDGRAAGARQQGLLDCNSDILPPRTMEKYDLIVIGSGPGGQRAAIQAAKFGKRAALIEKLEVIGGTAINT